MDKQNNKKTIENQTNKELEQQEYLEGIENFVNTKDLEYQKYLDEIKDLEDLNNLEDLEDSEDLEDLEDLKDFENIKNIENLKSNDEIIYELDEEGNPKIYVDNDNNIYYMKSEALYTEEEYLNLVQFNPEKLKVYIRQSPIEKEYSIYDIKGNALFELDDNKNPLKYKDELGQEYYIKTVYYFASNDEYNEAICKDDLKFYLF